MLSNEGEVYDYGGGGLYIWGGTVNMSGGTISNNTAGHGGGVQIVSGIFNMSGGTISSNKATKNGGGVSVSTYSGTGATFTMSNNAKIINNNATDSGGGVYIKETSTSTTFHLKGGTISGNKVTASNLRVNDFHGINGIKRQKKM